jgi:TonB-dependent starch-binding outer membrane protein SusC
MNKRRPIQLALLYFMRISLVHAIITSASILCCHAFDSAGQGILERKVSISAENMKIRDILSEIEVKADVKFTYRPRLIESQKKVTLHVLESKLLDVLSDLFGASVDYRVIGNQIVLKRGITEEDESPDDEFKLSSDAMVFQVTGKVTDENDQALPGVNVLIKSSTVGTTTDTNGNFTIEAVDQSTVLVFSFIGYATQEIVVGSRSVINVKMLADIQSLEEIVVVGYGTQKKADLTGAIGSLRGSDIDISSKPVTSADQILAGRVAGIQISNRSGDPGAPIDVRIRGVGTAGVNSPLWVIDGVPIVQTTNITVNTASSAESNPLAGINPADIESIDVLKDASAAAIYGARAANGVIIVTTKRGKDGKASVTYDGYVGMGEARKKFDMLNVAQYIDVQSQLGRDYSQFSTLPNVDWQDVVFRNGAVTNHNISVNGGSPIANYFVGVGVIDQEGTQLGQDFLRYSIKANSDIQVGKKLKFGESLLLSSVDRSVQSEDATFAGFNAALNQPFFKVYDPAGVAGYNLETLPNRGAGGNSRNYVMRTDPDFSETTVTSRKILANLYGELEILKGLKYRISGGIDYNVGDGAFFQSARDFNGNNRASTLVQERPIELTTNFNQTLTYNTTFNRHSITVLVGHEETNFEFEKIRLQGRNLFNEQIRFASTGSGVAAANEADHWALRGYLGRINYSYHDKYLFTFNVRQDLSSRFSKDNRSQAFPSISAGWRISEESFFSKGEVFDDVKVRIGWGQSGNQFTGTNFSYLSTLQPTIFYVLGTGNQAVKRGLAPINFANPDLKWETSSQIDVGLDMTLFQGKVDVTFDYYNKITRDILIGFPVPYTSGFFLPTDVNLGEMLNRGIELSIQYQNSFNKIKYSFGGNITTVHNEVLELGSVPEIITGVGGASTHRTAVGDPIGSFYGYKTDGIFQNASEISAADPDLISSGRAPGDIRFVDVNNDNQIDSKDRTNLGSPIPKYYYGINASANFMNFDFSILLQGVGGQKVYNQARTSMEDLRSSNNFLTSTLDAWEGEGSSTRMPRLTDSDPNQNSRFSDRWIEDASFMRIRNLQLGYAIPSTNLESWTNGFVSRFRIYVGVQNLATFTDYKGYDPEVTRGFSFQKGETPLANGQDSGGAPQPRIYQVGWQVTF